MKIKSLLWSALAASMVLVSCDSNEDVMGPQGDNTPKSVSINLANVVQGLTKSADQPVANNSQVTLTDFQVFFSDGTTLYKGKTAQGGDEDHYFTSVDALADKTFHFLPANVYKVIVLGNLGSQSQATTEGELAKTLQIEDQQDDANLDLYGESVLTAAAAGQDNMGHPLYEATVTLTPQVSRIEVTGFTYNEVAPGTARKYSKIEIDQIMVNNVYPQADNTTGAASGDLFPHTKNDISTSTVFGYFEDAKNAGSVWYNDLLNGQDAATSLMQVALEAANYTYSYADGNVRPAYHFFPNGADFATAAHPQLLVKLVGTTADNTEVPLYLATQTFQPAVTADPAKIYQLDFQFDDNDLGNPDKCVNVTVKVASWEVESVTPNFN